MPFLKKDHPWNGRYAIPDYVLSEPPGFGTHTTKQTPRGTISVMSARAPSWRSGYAVPAYIHEEPIGRGVFVTKQLPRKTISTTIPSMFATGNYVSTGLTQGLHPLEEERFPIVPIVVGVAVLWWAMGRMK